MYASAQIQELTGQVLLRSSILVQMLHDFLSNQPKQLEKANSTLLAQNNKLALHTPLLTTVLTFKTLTNYPLFTLDLSVQRTTYKTSLNKSVAHRTSER